MPWWQLPQQLLGPVGQHVYQTLCVGFFAAFRQFHLHLSATNQALPTTQLLQQYRHFVDMRYLKQQTLTCVLFV